MKIIAIIPARGGSKGLPRKNVLALNGKPLIAYTIENALQSKHVNRVVVSTDDTEIEKISKKFGAEVIWRPEELSTDTSSSEEALLHVLERLRQTEMYEPQLIVFLQCTSPLTDPVDIDGTIQNLLDNQSDCAFAATPFHYFLWRENAQGRVEGINHDLTTRVMRQDRTEQFLETGAVYVMRADGFEQAKHRFFGKTTFYVMPTERCLEIDDIADFKIAEALLTEKTIRQNTELFPEKIEAIAFDFDGVFTDNRVLVLEDGTEGVLCDRSDGLGLAMLRKWNLPIKVFSTEKNPVVMRRCSKLQISCVYDVKDKLNELKKWLSEVDAAPENVIFIGNDVNDLPCMAYVGCPVAVSDAYQDVKNVSRFVLRSPGGHGALREFIDLLRAKMRMQ
jgi:N-acylneuraminate cytidylyltransferase